MTGEPVQLQSSGAASCASAADRAKTLLGITDDEEFGLALDAFSRYLCILREWDGFFSADRRDEAPDRQ